ncbi:MAG: hypothetical protein ACJ0IB_07305 [Verrucomicrobiales bacterium]|nr:hypothetical protein [Verrucomicrobiales bacterium]
MKKLLLLLLLPLTLLFVVGCGDKFGNIKEGDRIIYAYEYERYGKNGIERVGGVQGGRDEAIWFVGKIKETVYLRVLVLDDTSSDYEMTVPLGNFLWVDKHPHQKEVGDLKK